MTQDELRAALLLMGFKNTTNSSRDMSVFMRDAGSFIVVWVPRKKEGEVTIRSRETNMAHKWKEATDMSPKEAFNFIKEKLT